jgi:putative ABC transport system permease protein
MIRVGIFREIVVMAVDSIKSHKLRSFLTILGIVIGVMTVIGMVSVIQGLNKSFLKELESAGSDLIIIRKFDPVQMGRRSESERQRKDLTLDDAKAIERNCPLLKGVSISLNVSVFEQVDIKYRNIKSDNSFIIGINEKFPTVYSLFLPKEGRYLTESEITHSSRVCVLGYELAEILFPHMSALGKEISVGSEKFTVVGVLSKRGQIFGQSRDNFVGIPVTALTKYYPYEKDSVEFTTAPRNHGDMQEAIQQVTNFLRQKRKVPYGKPNDFSIFTQESMMDLYNQLTGAAFLVMIVISSIGLMVGGIGVMNIMLVSVKERTREIGIRKALGARAGDIMRQFLIESIVLTGTGGVLGIVVGFLIAILVRAATPLPASVSPWSVFVGFAVSVSIGLFFGIFPAQKAAKMDPIVSLRYE